MCNILTCISLNPIITALYMALTNETYAFIHFNII